MTSIALPQELLDFTVSAEGATLREDLEVWRERYGKSLTADAGDAASLTQELFSRYPEFRTLLDYRVRTAGSFASDFKYLTSHRRGTELHLNTGSLGGGCFIQHGTGSWIFARSIGRGVFVYLNVTAGEGRGGGAPEIGDNVSIRTGAVVVGRIKIGSNVMIGANAVVSFDVPDGARVYAPRAVVVLPDAPTA